MLEQIKVLLNLQDDTKDTLLDALITLKSRKLIAALGGDEVPTELDYIIIELVINHYNRLGSEGLAAESIEGISRTYSDSAMELEPYKEAIAKSLNASAGKFRFY